MMRSQISWMPVVVTVVNQLKEGGSGSTRSSRTRPNHVRYTMVKVLCIIVLGPSGRGTGPRLIPSYEALHVTQR